MVEGSQARLLGEEEETVQERGEFRAKTKHGYMLDEVASSFQKDIRRGNEDGAMFWALEMVESGFANYLWNRIAVMVGEEIGLANPMAFPVISGMIHLYERRLKSWSKGPHTYEIVGCAILFLCRSPKNKEAEMAAYAVGYETEYGRRDAIPDYGRDFHTKAGREVLAKQRVSKEDQQLLWWLDWSIMTNLTTGNRWIKRVLAIDTDLSEGTREQVYQEYLKMYQETDENQV